MKQRTLRVETFFERKVFKTCLTLLFKLSKQMKLKVFWV